MFKLISVDSLSEFLKLLPTQSDQQLIPREQLSFHCDNNQPSSFEQFSLFQFNHN